MSGSQLLTLAPPSLPPQTIRHDAGVSPWREAGKGDRVLRCYLFESARIPQLRGRLITSAFRAKQKWRSIPAARPLGGPPCARKRGPSQHRLSRLARIEPRAGGCVRRSGTAEGRSNPGRPASRRTRVLADRSPHQERGHSSGLASAALRGLVNAARATAAA
jgi:hypothetical protein